MIIDFHLAIKIDTFANICFIEERCLLDIVFEIKTNKNGVSQMKAFYVRSLIDRDHGNFFIIASSIILFKLSRLN